MRWPILVLGRPDRAALVEAVEAGARGYLEEDAPLPEIVEAVHTVAAGGAVVPPRLLGALLRHLVDRRRRQERALDAALAELSPREREVFDLAAAGRRREEIADALYISPGTARTHLARIYRKLEVHSQTELMAFAARLEAIEEGEPDR